jgi:putative PIN family toxin of toxin-antitoxin system
MRSKKFVLDANIWVSYFLSNNISLLLEIISTNKITVLYCSELLTEIERVLEYPHLIKYNLEVKSAVSLVKKVGILATLNYPFNAYIPRDEDDSYIIALALQQYAGFVTSGDRHILSQRLILEKKYTKLKIISKSVFEKMFKK